MIATSLNIGLPTLPGLRSAGGSGLLVSVQVSVIP